MKTYDLLTDIRERANQGGRRLETAGKACDDIVEMLDMFIITEAEIVTNEILDELARARIKFPGDNVTMLALMEEVGELAKATFEEPRAAVRKEAIQVAVMAMRVVLDGDATLDQWRASKGLDPLVRR